MYILADVLDKLAEMPNPIFVIGGAVAIVAIVARTATKIAVGRSREQTKREIAAYVAEGTIDPEKAVEILKAGGASDDQ